MLLLFNSHIVVVFLFLLDTFGEGGRRARRCASVISKLRGAFAMSHEAVECSPPAPRCIHGERRTIWSCIVSFEMALPANVQRRMLFEFAIISCRGDGCVVDARWSESRTLMIKTTHLHLIRNTLSLSGPSVSALSVSRATAFGGKISISSISM